MPEKPGYEEMEQRVKELEKEIVGWKQPEEAQREKVAGVAVLKGGKSCD